MIKEWLIVIYAAAKYFSIEKAKLRLAQASLIYWNLSLIIKVP